MAPVWTRPRGAAWSIMAREEAERLNRLVGNLLDMTRIEAGALRAAEEPCDVQEVIGAALERLGERLAGRPVPSRRPPCWRRWISS